jgi:methionyl-tRNA synthetase
MGKKFLVCTAIDYPSGRPHAGHLYEKVAADVIARWKRLQGFDVHFSTGLDCHGQKIERAARQAGKSPSRFVDEMGKVFLELCEKYRISYDDFIKTTEDRHKKVVSIVFRKLHERGDIYKGQYEGLYCVDCETFYTERDLEKGCCPVHKKKAEWLKEESYFFRLGKYRQKIAEHIRKNPDFIRPESRRNEIINRLKGPVKDLSLTRKSVRWGIPFPPDRNFTTFVWVEALLNYLSTVDYPAKKFRDFWPSFNLIGKDILWHHSVIFGSMLLSAGLELPKLFVHGFVTMGGEKMSKSRGRVMDPLELVNRYPPDTIRYFLIREIPFGEDGDFSEKALKERINGELLSDLGNLVSRVLTLAEKNPKVKPEGKPELEERVNLKKIEGHMERLELHHALDEVFSFIRACNSYINETEPWKKSGRELGNILYNLLEGLRVIAILIHPFLPETAEKINRQLGVKAGSLKDARFGRFRGSPRKGPHLFEKAE